MVSHTIAVKRRPITRKESGVAAVEFSIILLLMIALIAFPLFFGRVFMSYSVAQKAALNSASYLAKIPLVEMHDPSKSVAAAEIAQEIVDATIGALKPGDQGVVVTQIQCDIGPCGAGVPSTVTVHVRIRMHDEFFNFLTGPILGDEGIMLNAKVTLRYVGA